MPRASGASSTPRRLQESRPPAFTGSSAYADDDIQRSPHHRCGLPEQNLALFLGTDRRLAEIRIDLFGLGVGALGGGANLDGFKPALHMRKLLNVLALVLVRHHPGIAGHVGDRIVARDELAIGEALVEHAI